MAIGLACAVASGCGGGGRPGVGGPASFTEVGLPPELDGRTFTRCLVFEDLDDDRLPDIFLIPYGDGNPVAEGVLLRNVGGAFEVFSVPFHSVQRVGGCAAADYDNDGLVDIYAGAVGDGVMLRNRGEMVFADISEWSGTGSGSRALLGEAPAFLDYDGDGRLDLYLGLQPSSARNPATYTCAASDDDFQCRFAAGVDPATVGVSSVILRNNGDARTFARHDDAVGADNAAPDGDGYGAPNAVAVLDYDRDGRTDLLVANDFLESQLYLNQANESFRGVAKETGFFKYGHGRGVAVGDFDADGSWDLYVAELGPGQLWMGAAGTPLPRLEERAFALGVGEPTRFVSSWAPIAADFNQDGWTDLFSGASGAVSDDTELDAIAHGRSVAATEGHATLFMNRGGAGFDALPLPQQTYAPGPASASSATADFDGDGDLDLAVVYGNAPHLYVEVLRNDTADPGNWLQVRLAGTKANREGIGAEVAIETGGFKQSRIVHGASGSGARSSGVMHFGLGKARTVDKITIRWPGGTTQEVPGPIPAGKVVDVTQP